MQREAASLIESGLRILFGVFLAVLMLAMCSATHDATVPIKNLVTAIFAVLLVGIAAIGILAGKLRPTHPPVFLWPLAALAIFLYLAAFFSEYPAHALREANLFALFFVIYFVAAQAYRTPGQVQRLMLVVCGAVGVSSLYGFCQWMGWDFFPWEDRTSVLYKELPGTFGNPNYATHVMILAVIMSVYLAAARKWFYLVFAAVFLLHINMAGTRSGLIGLAAASVLWFSTWAVSRRSGLRPARAVTFVLVLTLIIGGAGLLLALGAQKMRSGSAFPKDSSLVLRYNSYYGAGHMIARNPVLGFGPGNYVIENPPYWTAHERRWFSERSKMNRHVHSDPLELGVDGGLGAMAAYLTALLAGIGYGLYVRFTHPAPAWRRLGMAFAAFFCAFMVDGFFGFNLRVPASAALLFVLAGAFDGLLRRPAPETASRGGRQALVWAALALVAVLCAVTESRSFAAAVHDHAGRKAMKQGEYAAAASAFTKACKGDPGQWAYPMRLGQAEQQLGNPEAARAALEHSLELNANHIPAMTMLAQVHLQAAIEAAEIPAERGEFEPAVAQAMRYTSRALDLCPNLPRAHNVTGRAWSVRAIHLQMRDPAASAAAWERARQHLEQAFSSKPDENATVCSMLAQAHLALQDQDAAQSALVRATRTGAADQQVWSFFLKYANTYGRQGVMAQAAADAIERLDVTDPRERSGAANLHVWRARALRNDPEQVKEAESAYHAALRLRRQDVSLWAEYAGFAMARGRLTPLKAAILETDERLSAEGVSPPVGVAVMATAWAPGSEDLPAAAELLHQTVQTNIGAAKRDQLTRELNWVFSLLTSLAETGQDGPALRTLGQAYTTFGRHEQAAATFAKAAQHLQGEEFSSSIRECAAALERAGQPDKAIAVLQDGASQRPNDLDLGLTLARTLAREGLLPEALTAYRRLESLPRLTNAQRATIEQEIGRLTAM